MILPHRRRPPRSVSYEAIADRPAGYPPVAHTHPVTDLTGLDEAAQDAIGAMVDGSLVYADGPPTLSRAALTGDVTASQGSNATTIANDAVTNAKLANVATATFKGRATAGTGDPEDLTVTQAATLLLASVSELSTDADETIAVSATGGVTRHTGVLTADRALTLGTTGAAAGMWRRVVRTGGGAFMLNVGVGPLKALATNTWADFHYDGSAWRLTAYGAL